MFLKKSIVLKKFNTTKWVKELFNVTHTVLVALSIHKDGKTSREFSIESMLKKMLHKTYVGRKR